MNCSQCERPAVFMFGSHPLCVEHTAMVQSGFNQQAENLERIMNMLDNDMNDIVGLPRQNLFPPRKQPVVIQDKRIQNMIHIDRSVVGAVNLGTINNLEVSMSHINTSNPTLAQALKVFTEAVAKDPKLDSGQKQDALDQLSVLTNEVDRPKDQRRPGVIKALMGGIKSTVHSGSGLYGLWKIVEDIVQAFL